MKSFVLLLFLFTTATTWAAGCGEILLLAKPGDILLDSRMGLLRVVSYDPDSDTLEATTGDYHQSETRIRMNSKARPVKGSAPRILNASARDIGAIPSPKSSALAFARAGEVGFVRSAQFFALNAIAKRIEDPSAHPEWYEKIWVPSFGPTQPKLLLEGWRNQLLKAQPEEKIPELVQLILEIYRLTRENMVRTGILIDYTKMYARTWSWFGFQRSTTFPSQWWLKLNYIPQDIDHFLRSYLWNQSAELLELESDEQDIPLNTIPAPYKFILKKPKTYVPSGQPSQWRHIYDVAGTIKITDAVNGMNVRIDAKDLSDYQVQELMRHLYANGASGVYVIGKSLGKLVIGQEIK